HNPSLVLGHRCVARGFLPWGLSDACPPSSVASCSLAQEGRHQTTLNSKRRTLISSERLVNLEKRPYKDCQ
ncbi:MAG: hypothetical protein ACXWAT_11020, partial [Methylobacter sp.]